MATNAFVLFIMTLLSENVSNIIAAIKCARILLSEIININKVLGVRS